MLPIILIFKCYDSIDHIHWDACISDIFPIFFKQSIKDFSISIFDKRSFIKYHVLDFADIRKTNQYIPGESESEYDNKENKSCNQPKSYFLLLIWLIIIIRWWWRRVWSSAEIRRIESLLIEITHRYIQRIKKEIYCTWHSRPLIEIYDVFSMRKHKIIEAFLPTKDYQLKSIFHRYNS